MGGHPRSSSPGSGIRREPYHVPVRWIAVQKILVRIVVSGSPALVMLTLVSLSWWWLIAAPFMLVAAIAAAASEFLVDAPAANR
ncbi:hypothetical protein [Rhodococcus globerulus]|uniref:Uncharacterized protein n=1 Tax=Rhodococcus globerulus TaxID=33008 RepID=A0ABU4C5I5_RHOGO|nr:hypothetical protein [Rhodococcus globerulus]MDV6271768.1 hypothetical protein [Rhodococcus globerulus]